MSFLWTKEKVYCIINSYQQQPFYFLFFILLLLSKYSFSIGKTAGGFFVIFFI